MTSQLEENQFLSEKFDMMGEISIPDRLVRDNRADPHFSEILLQDCSLGFKVIDDSNSFYMGFAKYYDYTTSGNNKDVDFLKSLSALGQRKYNGKG